MRRFTIEKGSFVNLKAKRPKRAMTWLVPGCLLLAGCGAAPPPAPVRTVVAAPEPLATPTAPSVAEPPDPCDELGRIVDAEPEGFLVPRGRPEGAGRWGGTATPAGFADCWIEDLATAGPHYLCRAERFAGTPEALAADHLTLLSALDSCLARPTWFPLGWRRVPEASGPDGSRRSAWRVGTSGPVVALTLAPHPDRPLWWNLLVVGPTAAPR